jgi:CheY-like chemotaxis protein
VSATHPTVLIADDEDFFVTSIDDALRSRIEGVRVLHARDGREALHLLEQQRVSLLLTDLSMPHMGGVELLAALTRLGIHVPTIVITAHRSGTESRLHSLGALAIVDKPVDLNALLALVERRLSDRSPASLEGVSLPGFLQLLAMERKTCLVRIIGTAGASGTFAFVDGQLVDARTAGEVGDRAAMNMLTWVTPSIHVEPTLSLIEETIQSSLAHLVLETARIEDEGDDDASIDDALDQMMLAGDTKPAIEDDAKPTASRRTGEIIMSNVTDTLTECMNIDGAIGAALVDYESGLTLGTSGGRSDFDIELAASGNTQVVRSKVEVMKSLGLKGAIEDILITLEDQVHLIRPLRTVGTLFLYVAIDKQRGNLGLARHKLTSLEKDLKV